MFYPFLKQLEVQSRMPRGEELNNLLNVLDDKLRAYDVHGFSLFYNTTSRSERLQYNNMHPQLELCKLLIHMMCQRQIAPTDPIQIAGRRNDALQVDIINESHMSHKVNCFDNRMIRSEHFLTPPSRTNRTILIYLLNDDCKPFYTRTMHPTEEPTFVEAQFARAAASRKHDGIPFAPPQLLQNFESSFARLKNQWALAYQYPDSANVIVFTNSITWELFYATIVTFLVRTINNSIGETHKDVMIPANIMDTIPELLNLLIAAATANEEMYAHNMEKLIARKPELTAISKAINDAMNPASEGKIKVLQKEIERNEQNFMDNLKYLKDLDDTISQQKIKLAGLIAMAGTPRASVDLVNFVERNKYIHHIQPGFDAERTCDNGREADIILYLHAPLVDFEEYAYDKCVVNTVNYQFNLSTEQTIMRMLTAAFFKNMTHRYWISAAVQTNLITGRVNDISNSQTFGQGGVRNVFGNTITPYKRQIWLKYPKHPHMGIVHCWGGHSNLIAQAAKDSDKTMVLTRICAAYQNINLLDPPVLSNFIRDLSQYGNPIPHIENVETGEMKTILETVMELLKKNLSLTELKAIPSKLDRGIDRLVPLRKAIEQLIKDEERNLNYEVPESE